MELIITKAFVYNLKLEKLLAIKRSDNDYPGVWENPGGGLKNGETPEACIKRVIMEETGLLIKNPEFIFDDKIPNTNIVFKNYIVTTTKEEITLSDEHTEYKWLAVNDYLNIVDETIKDSFNKHMVIYELKGFF